MGELIRLPKGKIDCNWGVQERGARQFLVFSAVFLTFVVKIKVQQHVYCMYEDQKVPFRTRIWAAGIDSFGVEKTVAEVYYFCHTTTYHHWESTSHCCHMVLKFLRSEARSF